MDIQKSLFKDVLNCINSQNCIFSISDLNEDLKNCGINRNVTKIKIFKNSFSIFVDKLEVKFFYDKSMVLDTIVKRYENKDNWFGENVYINIVDTLQEILK